MLKLETVIGLASDPEVAERLHDLQHAGRVEYLNLQPEDMQRHRLRVKGDQGTEYAIAIPRNQLLTDGAVLMLQNQKAVVVCAKEQRWLQLSVRDTATALQLGYLAGNMHWAVRFDGPIIAIALRGPETDYLRRLKEFLATGSVVLER